MAITISATRPSENTIIINIASTSYATGTYYDFQVQSASGTWITKRSSTAKSVSVTVDNNTSYKVRVKHQSREDYSNTVTVPAYTPPVTRTRKITLDTVNCTVTGAYHALSGSRQPSSGYTTLIDGTYSIYDDDDLGNFYIYDVSFSSGYGYPVNISYAGTFMSQSTKPTKVTSGIIGANLFPYNSSCSVTLTATKLTTYDYSLTYHIGSGSGGPSSPV